MYFIMALFGIIFTFIICMAKRKAFALRERDILLLVTFATIGALLGSKFFGIIGQIYRHRGHPNFWSMEHLSILASSGLVFYGGLIGGFGMATLWAKIGKIDMKSLFNVAAYAALAFQSIGRLGCYFAGCCYGITLADGTLFPVQLFEAGFCFVALLAFLIIRPERRWPKLPLFPVYLIIYAVGRFILEFLRGDASRGVWILSTSQWISLVLIVLAVVWLWNNEFFSQLFKTKPSLQEDGICD